MVASENHIESTCFECSQKALYKEEDNMSDYDFGKAAREYIDEALRKQGRVNILVCGKTGVGKSTLINAVFAGNLATTGQGRPVATEIREIKKEGIPVSIFDTKGIELVSHEDDLRELIDFVRRRKNEEDPHRHIHVTWLCISEDSRRVEEMETRLAQELAEHIPVITVITKARSDNGFRAVVQRLIPTARNVVRVRALAETLDDGHRLEPFGLEELVDLTNEVVPEGQRAAFIAAQKVSLDQKRSAARKIIIESAVAAAGFAATPVPFAHALGLIPIQVAMLARISVAYGLSMDKAMLGTVVSSTIGTVLATAGGRALVGELIKLAPGAGPVVGGLINAGVASGVTTTFGTAYSTALYYLLKEDPNREITPEEVVARFKQELRLVKVGSRESAASVDDGEDS